MTLTVKGNATLHVVGFYEPDQEADLPFGEEDLEDLEDEESEEEEVEVKSKETKEAPKSVAQQQKAPEAAKPKAQEAQKPKEQPKVQPAKPVAQPTPAAE